VTAAAKTLPKGLSKLISKHWHGLHGKLTCKEKPEEREQLHQQKEERICEETQRYAPLTSSILSLFHSECLEPKFLLRNGDPSFKVFLNFCDSSAKIRRPWLVVTTVA